MKPFIRSAAAFPLMLALVGCGTSPEKARIEQEARATAAAHRQHFEDRDVQAQMAQRAVARFPAVDRIRDEAFRAGKPIVAPKLIHVVHPKYPFGKRLNLAQGGVWVAFVVDVNGNVTELVPLLDDAIPIDAGFTKAATDAVAQWKFAPGTIDGQPMPFVVAVPVVFEMKL